MENDKMRNQSALDICKKIKENIESGNYFVVHVGLYDNNEDLSGNNYYKLVRDKYFSDKAVSKYDPDKISELSLISSEFIKRKYPLTYSEELIYNTVFVEHPMVGYEKMLVPLEKYYKFLSEQSFYEFLNILVKLGIKKVELIHSENQLMKNALNAYANYSKLTNIVSVSGDYKSSSAESKGTYWRMEFEGKQVKACDIGANFLSEFPFHSNNGTLKAMIEGIRSGNRSKSYTVERSFTGNFGLDINVAVKVLGFDAGFNFNKELYTDEKSTFSVSY